MHMATILIRCHHITSLHWLSRVWCELYNNPEISKLKHFPFKCVNECRQTTMAAVLQTRQEKKISLDYYIRTGTGFQRERRIARAGGAAGKEEMKETQGFKCDEWILRCQQISPSQDSPVNLCLLSRICANQTPRLGLFKRKNEKLKAYVRKA